MLVYQLYINSALPRAKVWIRIFSGRTWDPVSGDFGALPFIYGTVVSSALALLVAVPLGVGAAIFLSELAPPRISNYLTFVIELLAAVPSVIYRPAGDLRPGSGIAQSGDAVSEAYAGIPSALQRPDLWRQHAGGGTRAGHHDCSVHHLRLARSAAGRSGGTAGSGLGAGRHKWESTWQVVVPFARVGIMASVFLALARALGETMAVTMVIGNDPKSALRFLRRATRSPR